GLPLAPRRGPQGDLAASRLLQGGRGELPRHREGRRRRGHRDEPAAGARPASPQPHLRPAVAEGRVADRTRLLKRKESAMETPNLDFVHLIRQGAISTYPLLLCSIIMLGVVLERLWTLRGAVSSTGSLTAQIVPLLARGDLAGAVDAVRRHRRCPAHRVFGDVLQAAPEAPLEQLERVADERQFEEVEGCGAYLWILGTIGSWRRSSGSSARSSGSCAR